MPEYDTDVVARVAVTLVGELMNALKAKGILTAGELSDVLNASIAVESKKPNGAFAADLIHRLAGSDYASRS